MKHTLLLVMAFLWSFVGSACTRSPDSIDRTSTPLAALTTNAPTGDSRTALAYHMQVVSLDGMTTTRASHTATALHNNQVLVAGGFGGGERAIASAELFDPSVRTFSLTSFMSAARQSHTATRLPDGKVLMAGGYNGDYLDSAELYDPATGTFSPTGSMTMARSEHTAVLLGDGKVLIVGGVGTSWTFLNSAELYDPVSGTFSATGSMAMPRESHTATLLKNGKVLITGGHQGRHSAIAIYTSAELYEPPTGTFTATGNMAVRRHKHDATLLPDGRVLVTGGSDERDDRGAYTSAEIYDSDQGNFTSATPMHVARYKHRGTSQLLPGGQVLLLGGASSTEIYDPGTETFRLAPESVGTARLFATATLLADGKVLLAGGYGTDISASARAWLIYP